MKLKTVIYFVEGKTEKAVINAIKNKYIISGKVLKLNLWEKDVTLYLKRFERNSHIICVLDTDIVTKENSIKKDRNLEKLRKFYHFDVVYQNKNLENEIVLSTTLKNILEMYKVQNINKHKQHLISDKNLMKRLENINFNNNNFWNDGGAKIKMYLKRDSL